MLGIVKSMLPNRFVFNGSGMIAAMDAVLNKGEDREAFVRSAVVAEMDRRREIEASKKYPELSYIDAEIGPFGFVMRQIRNGSTIAVRSGLVAMGPDTIETVIVNAIEMDAEFIILPDLEQEGLRIFLRSGTTFLAFSDFPEGTRSYQVGPAFEAWLRMSERQAVA